jgi:hypothetical protein
VDQATIVMTVNGSSVSPTISGSPAAYTLTYDPPVDFGYEETADVTVDGADLDGNAMATDAYSFTTTTAPDITPPYTTNHSPAPGATGVAINTLISLELRDAGVGVDQATIAMTVNGSAVTPAISGTPAAYTLTYDPPVDFGYEETVTVTVDGSDQNGNAMATDTYSFTTTTAPDVEVIVDTADSEFTTVGAWLPSSDPFYPYYGSEFYYSLAGTGENYATFRPNLPVSGDFEVFIRYATTPAGSTNQPFTINYSGGSTTVRINFQGGVSGAQWLSLGVFPFVQGTSGSVVTSNDSDSYAGADAVRWVLIHP